jgi:glucose uptake protein GlcU
MAFVRFSKQLNPPNWLAMLHGLLAAAGLTLLLYAAFAVGIPTLANVGLVILVIAALGGLLLNLKYQWQRALLPPGLMVGHALVAVIGFVLVLIVAVS